MESCNSKFSKFDTKQYSFYNDNLLPNDLTKYLTNNSSTLKKDYLEDDLNNYDEFTCILQIGLLRRDLGKI